MVVQDLSSPVTVTASWILSRSNTVLAVCASFLPQDESRRQGKLTSEVHFQNFALPENAGKMRSSGGRSCVVLRRNRLVGAPFPGASGIARAGRGMWRHEDRGMWRHEDGGMWRHEDGGMWRHEDGGMWRREGNVLWRHEGRGTWRHEGRGTWRHEGWCHECRGWLTSVAGSRWFLLQMLLQAI